MGNAFAKAVQKSAKKTADKPKKSSAPGIKLSKELAGSLNRLMELKKEVKTKTSKMRLVEAELIEHAREVQDQKAFSGNYVNSYELIGRNGETAKFITQEKWSIPREDEELEELRELLGDQADEILKDDTQVQLKPEVFEDEELQERLMELLGDEFGTFFDTTTKVVTNGKIAEKLYKVAGDQDKLESIRALLSQAKPSIQ
jgi:hypothetical protein